MHKGQEDTGLVGKMEVRRPQADKKDSGKTGFSRLPQGRMWTANRPGNTTPQQSQWRLMEPSHSGPLGPFTGLSSGLSLSPRSIAFTDLIELEKDRGGGARETAFFLSNAKS